MKERKIRKDGNKQSRLQIMNGSHDRLQRCARCDDDMDPECIVTFADIILCRACEARIIQEWSIRHDEFGELSGDVSRRPMMSNKRLPILQHAPITQQPPTIEERNT
jgi:hypothetical protein